MSDTALNETCHIRELMESAGIELRRRGHELVGLCPFHADTHPSLAVNVDKNLWYCFACAEGGDAIRFVEKLHGVGFKEAINLLGLNGVPPRRSSDCVSKVEARRIAEWAQTTSETLSDKLRVIGNLEYHSAKPCELCGVQHLFLEAEQEKLHREWEILCDLDDDLNDPAKVLELWQNRETINTFIGSL